MNELLAIRQNQDFRRALIGLLVGPGQFPSVPRSNRLDFSAVTDRKANDLDSLLRLSDELSGSESATQGYLLAAMLWSDPDVVPRLIENAMRPHPWWHRLQ